MSGTSLDGLDMALVEFWRENKKWHYKIIKSNTIEYSKLWVERLKNAHNISGEKLRELDIEYGHLLGKLSADFISAIQKPIELVSSHGHTIFHNPAGGYTLQIGDGNAIISHLNCPVIFDFRTQDIANMGQGAPLVPIGDELLFAEYDACINLGGFANISIKNPTRKAWDICAANFVLNKLANKLGMAYDRNGEIAQSGIMIEEFYKQLEGLDFYRKSAPKSLGREWVESEIFPLINHNFSIENQLHTFTIHIANRICEEIKPINGKILITGGGAKNIFLIDKIKEISGKQIIIPDETTIDFKEALIFAFMGLLRKLEMTNIFGQWTGGTKDICAGSMILPSK